MENQKEHFRHILLFYFRKGKNASQAHKKLCAVYGDEALRERQCQNWFAKFRSGDFSLKDEKRSGRPVEVDDDLMKAIIDTDRHSTTREIAEKLHVSHTCIENHLKQLG
ncbi:histone-lysine N-methyltransferase SETMAR [Trichonephila clavipes]|nr:histone-lysine N-methyltransferase SETMAR [Trichonephila clavipes]